MKKDRYRKNAAPKTRNRFAILAFLGLSYGVFVILVDMGRLTPALDCLAYLPGGGDELGHFFLFFGGGWILRWAMEGKSDQSRQLSFLLSSLILIFEEFSQHWLPGRSFSWLDLSLGLLGLLLGFSLKGFMLSRRRSALPH